MKKYQLLPHRADLKIRVFGKNRQELFANAVLGMFQSIIKKKFKDLKIIGKKELKIKADSIDNLLVNFLNELIYWSDLKNELYQVKKIKIKGYRLRTILLIHPIKKNLLKTEIKAVTHHNLKIKKCLNHLEAEIIFDI